MNTIINDASRDRNKIIDIIKGIAILLIVASHSCFLNTKMIYSELNHIVSYCMLSCSSVGVVLFFGVSGYLFGNNKRKIKDFFIKKLRLVIPWIFSSLIIYFYVGLRKRGMSLIDYLLNFIGYDSIYWYLTVLMFLYFIFFFIPIKRIILIIFAAISMMCTVLVAEKIIPSIYINPLHWIFYFNFGLYLNKSQFKFRSNKKYLIYEIFSVIFVVWTISVAVLFKSSITYWKYLYIIYATVSAVALSAFAAVIMNSKQASVILSSIGSQSLSVYLFHMPIAGIIAYLFNKIDIWWTTFLRPFLVVLLTIMFLEILRYISNKLHIKKIIPNLLGD